MAYSRSGMAKRHRTNKKPSGPRTGSRSKTCRAPHSGQKCLKCGKGKLDYDGFLQLCCPVCGYLASGGDFI